MATNDFIGFANSGSANIASQADYAAAAEQGIGMQPGPASSKLANKVWRQGANMAAVLGEMIADAGYNALDNGDLAALKTALYGGLSARVNAEFSAGTFTPTIRGGTTEGSFTYSSQAGTYIKFNKLCFVEFNVVGKVATVPTGIVYIGGFPFAPSTANQSLLLNLGPTTAGLLSAAPVWIRLGTNPSNSIVWGVNTNTNLITSLTFGSLSVNTEITFRSSGIYRTV